MVEVTVATIDDAAAIAVVKATGHVLPEARGRGVGSALLDRVALEVAERGATTMVVEVVEQNDRTRQLYERLGARYVETAPASWAPEHVREAHYRWDDLAPLRHENPR